MAKKKFGQNFLVDDSIIDAVIRLFDPQEEHIVEIGPGKGALTKQLAEKASRLDVIEIDQTLIPNLQTLFKKNEQVFIHLHDVLTFDFESLPAPFRLIGNLPYNISTPLLFYLTQFGNKFKNALFMLQKEVVDRIYATPNHKAYSKLSVILQYHFEAKKAFDVPPEAFSPKPKVISSMILLEPKQQKLELNSYQNFVKVVHQAFNYRRKTLKNTLKSCLDEHAFQQLDIDPSNRPENLSLEDYVAISNYIMHQNI